MPNTKIEEFRPNYLALKQLPAFDSCGVLSNETRWHGNRHKHLNSCEIVLVASGTGHTRIENDIYRFSSGDLILYNEGVVHAESLYSQEEPLRVYYLVLKHVAIEDLPVDHLIPEGVSPVLASGENFADLVELFELIVAECGEQAPGYEMAGNGLATSLLVKVIRIVDYHYKMLHIDSHQSLGSRIRNYIEQNYAQPLTLKSIANHFCISHYYMEHLFKANESISPINYLIAVRMQVAQRLLETTDYSIKAIAAMTGYESAAYFCVAFKKAVGQTATLYRATHRRAPTRSQEGNP